MPDRTEPPSPPRRIDVLARSPEMRGQARQPRLPQTLIHHLEQSPNRPLRQPRIRIRLDPGRRRHRIPDEPAAATGSRRSRTPHRPAHPPPRADPTSAARATAPCRASARRRLPARTGRATDRRAAREAPRPGRRPAQLDGRAAQLKSLPGRAAGRLRDSSPTCEAQRGATSSPPGPSLVVMATVTLETRADRPPRPSSPAPTRPSAPTSSRRCATWSRTARASSACSGPGGASRRSTSSRPRCCGSGGLGRL